MEQELNYLSPTCETICLTQMQALCASVSVESFQEEEFPW